MWASEGIAVGDCDRCGLTFPLRKLKNLTIRFKKTNLRVCSECFESDHSQYRAGTMKVFDPQAIRSPRPELNDDRGLTPADAIGAKSAVVGRAVVGIAIVGRPLI